MPKRLTRQEMYDLAWLEPMRRLAKTFGISDVGLAKHFHQMHVPVPPRGYWARKAAGKATVNIELPPRPPGLNDHAWFGRDRNHYFHPTLTEEEILGPLPPEPSFEEPIERVWQQIEAAVGKVTIPKGFDAAHPAVAKLLQQDADKLEKQRGRSYISIFDALLYDTPAQRRRLRLLSAIFTAVAKFGGRAESWGNSGLNEPMNEFVAMVGHQRVWLRAEVVETKRNGRTAKATSPPERKVRLTLSPSDSSQRKDNIWEDGDRPPEQNAREIVIGIIVRGEEQHRAAAIESYERRVKLKADTIDRIRHAREDAERKEHERQAEMERKRVERLLGDADAFRKAREIRTYVAEARCANVAAAEPMEVEEFESWARWALAQADRLDPVLQGAFQAILDGLDS